MAAATALLAAPHVARAQGAGGVALVIGNSKYQWEASLPNVRRDAPDVAKRFQAMGLKTELLQDLSKDALRQAVDRFSSSAAGANLAALYFAGHGATWEKETYLVPVDVDLGTPSNVKTLLPVSAVSRAVQSASHRLLVFDSCRNNPADGWRQLEAERGARFNVEQQRDAAATAEPNSLTLFSTAPGRVALDGPAGENSPFAASFLHQLSGNSVDLAALPGKIRRELLIATEGRQVLWDRNTYSGSFAVKGVSGGTPGTTGDPSRIIELPNAYAFARKSGIELPQGLIAHRAPPGTPHAQKAGSYEFTALTPRGPMPYLVVVLSAEATGTAQLITAIQNDAGRIWRFVTGSISNNRLTFQPSAGRPNYLLDWSDTNSGSVAVLSEGNKPGQGNTVRSVRFSRLDG